jgi:hypothetical protein
MSFPIGRWAFGNVYIEQAFDRVFSGGDTGDLTAPARLGRRAVPPGQGTQDDGGGEESEALAMELGLVAKRDAGRVGQLEHRVAEDLGREAKP